MAEEEIPEKTESVSDHGYTAFEHHEYVSLIHVSKDQEKSWLDMGQSFYRASLHLVEGVASGALNEDIEGIAAIYLFRHYLELALKQIVNRGRHLKDADGELANPEDIKAVAKIHDLAVLWKWVLEDAKPKLSQEDWDNYDVAFVEQCVKEFDEADRTGFAFRYAGLGGERCNFDFQRLVASMEHVEQVLDGIITYLEEGYQQSLDYLADLETEYGSDYGW
jgi:hypothetical protein